jgi:hypothetical protein
MKQLSFFTTLLCLLLMGQSTVFAQANPILSDKSFDSNRKFLLASQKRFQEYMKQASHILKKEASDNMTLQKLNDSLLTKGEIIDTTSKRIQGALKAYQHSNDSIQTSVTQYATLLNNFSAYKKKYSTVIKILPVFYKAVVTNETVKQNLLLLVERELKNSNLAGEKKALTVILNNASSQQEKDATKIGDLDKTKSSLLQFGTIDDSTATTIDSRLIKYQRRIDSITNEIKSLQTSIASPEEYSKNSTIIKSRVTLIDSVVNKNAVARQYTFSMIEAALKKSTKTLFSLAAFFGPGGYAIPEEKYKQARQYFSPVVDSLIKFSNQYATLPRTATILVNGYADGTEIPKTSKLYPILTKYLETENPTKEALNSALSALRAQDLSALFTRIINERSAEFVALPKIIFENIEVGRGEQLPDATIKNYKEDDDRRRIVIVYWNVLPND